VDVQLIGVPYNSAGHLGGEAAGPLTLRDAGLVARLQAGVPAHDAGDVAFAAPDPTRSPRSGLIAEGALASMVGAVHGAVGAAYAAARFPLLIGGECPLLLGALAAARDAYGEVGLLFVDGHEDAWPPHRSLTGEAADSGLACALGRDIAGLPAALAALLPLVRPDTVALLGPRDADELAQAGCPSLAGVAPLYRPEVITSRGAAAVVAEAMRGLGQAVGHWWYHVDLDVLATDALAAVRYPQPGGLSWADLDVITAAALSSPACVGWDVVIYNPDLDVNAQGARRIVAYIGALAAPLAARGSRRRIG